MNQELANEERGSAVIEFTWFTLLAIVPLLYLVLAVFETQRTAFALSNASAAAARAFVQAESSGAALAAAQRAADLTMADHGRDPVTIAVECAPACHLPGAMITVDLDTIQPLPLAPVVFGESIASIPVSATHTEPYGTHRAAR